MSNNLKNVIRDMERHSIYDLLIPINWGVWNILASLLVIFTDIHQGIIWMGMIFTAIILHLILHKYIKKKKGYTLFSEKMVKWIWVVVIIAIFNITFLFSGLFKLYDMIYTTAFVSLLIGTGLVFTGLVLKEKIFIFAGIIWFIAGNFQAIYPNYIIITHLLLSIITLTLFPIIIYLFGKRKQ